MPANLKASPSTIRQQWLEALVHSLRPYFKTHDGVIPSNVRVSIGWPRGSRGGKTSHTIGQCWSNSASSDDHHEVFISPALRDTVQIIGVMAHELVHATVGVKAGHKGAFKRLAVAVGLEGKMTATVSGPALLAWSKDFEKEHGKYPSGSINASDNGSGPKKQGTRLVKCECDTCGYIVRTTAKWLEEAGAPYCGHKSHGRMSGGEDGE